MIRPNFFGLEQEEVLDIVFCETDRFALLLLVPEISRAPPVPTIASFADVHGNTPVWTAAEEASPYESFDLNQERIESNADFDPRIIG